MLLDYSRFVKLVGLRRSFVGLLQHLSRFAFKQHRVKQPNLESRLALLAAVLDEPEIAEAIGEMQFYLP